MEEKQTEFETEYAADNADITQSQACNTGYHGMQEVDSLCVSK